MPSTYPIALQLSKDGRRAFVALWNASEIVELDLEKNAVGRKLALLKPTNPIKPGTHPCAFALSGGWQDAVRGAGESRCCGGGECGRGAVRGEGILRYAAAGAELFWRGAGGAGAECVGEPAVCGEHGHRCGCGDRHAEADGEDIAHRDGRAGWICADGVDADVDGVPAVGLGRASVCGDRQRERDTGRIRILRAIRSQWKTECRRRPTTLRLCCMDRWRL